jgi:hypothetical protein
MFSIGPTQGYIRRYNDRNPCGGGDEYLCAGNKQKSYGIIRMNMFTV